MMTRYRVDRWTSMVDPVLNERPFKVVRIGGAGQSDEEVAAFVTETEARRACDTFNARAKEKVT